MRVVAFNGSARKDGNTAILVRAVFAELEAEGIETELVQLYNKNLRGCNACLKCAETQDSTCPGQKDDWRPAGAGAEHEEPPSVGHLESPGWRWRKCWGN